MSLKQSTQIIRRYPGNLGEDDLKNAINLLFLIKGKLIQKKSPDFIIPTAEEFFFLCRTVSEEFYNKMQPKKLHRALSSERIDRTHKILEFLETIVHSPTQTITDRMCMCVFIVFYSLFVYIYTNILYKTNDMQILTDDTNIVSIYKHLFINPIRAFCIHTMPCLEKHRSEILALCISFFKTNISPNISTFTKDAFSVELPILKTAQSFSAIFDSVVISTGIFDSVLKKPILQVVGCY